MWGMILCGIFLVTGSIEDIMHKGISIPVIYGFGVIAAAYHISTGGTWMDALWKVMTGLVVMALCIITRGRIGMGDALALIVIGMFTDAVAVMRVFMMALFISAVAGIVLIILKKAGRKSRLPFLPFLSAGYGVEILMTYMSQIMDWMNIA